MGAGGDECIAGGVRAEADDSTDFASGEISGGVCCGGAIIAVGASALALSFGATGAAISFKMTVLFAISCKC